MSSFSSLPDLSINLSQELLDKFLTNWESLRQNEAATGFVSSLVGLCRNLLESNLLANDVFFEQLERNYLPDTRSIQVSSFHTYLASVRSNYSDENCEPLITDESYDAGRFVPIYHEALSRLGNRQKTRVSIISIFSLCNFSIVYILLKRCRIQS